MVQHSTLGRRQFLQGVAGLSLTTAALGLMAGCGPLASLVRPARVARIGWLSRAAPPFPALSPTSGLSAFLHGLRELGWVEDQNLAIEYRWADGRDELLPYLAADLVLRQVDVLVVRGMPETRAARDATTTVPVVMAFGTDPVGSGLVASLARPGGNVTGLASQTSGLGGKLLDLLKEIVPAVNRVSFFWIAASPGMRAAWNETEAAAETLGVELHSVEVRGPGELDGQLETATRLGTEAVVTFGAPWWPGQLRQIMNFVQKSGLPSIHDNRDEAVDGGLMAYGPNLSDSYRRAASYVDKVLKGVKPADLPVELPTRLYLTLNMKRARELGLGVPQPVLRQADEFIQ